MEALGYSDSGTKNITLSQLEETISQAIASIYWRGKSTLHRIFCEPR